MNSVRMYLASFLCLLSIMFGFCVPAFGAEAKASSELPFYFPKGIIQTTDPVKQMQEYIRYLISTRYKFQGEGKNSRQGLIPGSDSIIIQTDIVSTSCVASLGSDKCKIILDHFVRMPDGLPNGQAGKIRVTQLADQFFITENELAVVADDLTALVKQASEGDYEYWKETSELAIGARVKKVFASTINVTPTVSVTATAGATNTEVFKKLLDEKDPLSGVTFRELNSLPRNIHPSDFVPRELHLGYNPQLDGILGACWLNTGIIYYNPQARIVDYLVGRPKVLQHEMIHCNYVLEKFPLSSGFDAELFAMFPEIFFEENKLDLFFHGYGKDLREICEIYFGFDFAEARNQIFKFDLAGSVIIDEVKFREYDKKIEEIKKELSHTFKEHIIPEFYSDSLWWSTMHDKLGDNNGLFWIMMAKYYRPTILNNARETAIWLSAHREEIMDMAKDAFKTIGVENKSVITVGGKEISPSFQKELLNFLTLEERKRVSVYLENNPAVLKKISGMSISEAIGFIRVIAQGEGGVMTLEK